MSLILCRQEPVTSPYYIEELGIHIYSSQELCYVIYNHPLLVMEDFVNDRLVTFLRVELRMPFLAERISKWIDGRGASDELLFLILQDCAYYSTQEQARYRQEIMNLRRLSTDEYAKRRADYLYTLGLYGRAISIYEKLLESERARGFTPEFRAGLWNNIAGCYARLFCYQKAMHAYDCAWNEKPEKEFLKRMYFLTLMQPGLSLKEKYREMFKDEDTESWNKEVLECRTGVQTKPAVKQVAEIFEKDPLKRISGAGGLLNGWKLEYRKMI